MMFQLIFVIMIGIFIWNVGKGIGQWNQNNQAPRRKVAAKVIKKYTNVIHHHHANAGDSTGAHGFYTTTSLSYHAVFHAEGGDRIECSLSDNEYRMLTEGDQGKLELQGTRYLGFEKEGEGESYGKAN